MRPTAGRGRTICSGSKRQAWISEEGSRLGRFCILCSRIRPNEAFGGKGERARICRNCRRMPREKRDALLREREIPGFLEQSHISPKNLARLRALGRSENTRTANLAHLVLDVGAATPYRRRRIRSLTRERRDILKRMEEVGLIMPPLPPEDMDHYDIDPVAAWYEWVEYARSCNDE
jgi:hypothetical protein